MSPSQIPEVGKYFRKEVEGIHSVFKGVIDEVKDSWDRQAARTVTEKLNSPPLIEPSRLRTLVIALVKVLIAIEILGALAQGINKGDWSRLGIDLLLAGILYILWERITRLTQSKKEEYRRKMEQAGDTTRLWDALAFSLLWTDEIYSDIPVDRRRFVTISYILIGLGLVVAFVGFGEGFMSLIISGALVLAAVNLLGWVVSRERGERESLETEMRLAHDVQVGLMPKCCPPVEGFDIGGQSHPAREVGGDHFDYCYIDREQGKFAISVFDVSGKGMQAAMTAVFTTGAFVSEARGSASPADILGRLNKAVYRNIQRGHFVAFLLGVLDVRRREFTFANAGQTKPLLRRGGEVLRLNSLGVTFPLGMTESASYEQKTVRLEPGDVLVFMSDGYTEAMDARRELFGEERLVELLRTMPVEEMSANAIISVMTEKVYEFAGGAPQHDDMTMVVVRVQ